MVLRKGKPPPIHEASLPTIPRDTFGGLDSFCQAKISMRKICAAQPPFSKGRSCTLQLEEAKHYALRLGADAVKRDGYMMPDHRAASLGKAKLHYDGKMAVLWCGDAQAQRPRSAVMEG